MIEIFDVHRPGNESDKIPTIPTRKSRKGQKGIISCLDFSLDGLYAAGSYSQSIAIYDQVNHELCLKLVDEGLKTIIVLVKLPFEGKAKLFFWLLYKIHGR